MGLTHTQLESKLHATTDARVWAREWCRLAREIEGGGGKVSVLEEWMTTWFANAIEVGRDEGRITAVPDRGVALLHGEPLRVEDGIGDDQ